MTFKDFQEFLEPLRLPINGKTYEIPPVDVQLGIDLLNLLQTGDESALGDDPIKRTWARLLGSAGEEMIRDGVPMAAYDRAALTALTDYQHGREAAERTWEVGIHPEALAALVAASTRSSSTDEATATPSPASTSGTTSRPAMKATAGKKAASRGRKSSSSGASSKRTGSPSTGVA